MSSPEVSFTLSRVKEETEARARVQASFDAVDLTWRRVICEAMESGASRSAVSRASGVSRLRIQQIQREQAERAEEGVDIS